MVKCVVHYNSASAAGVEDVKVGIFNTWATIIGGRECTSVKWGSIDWFVLAASTLMNNAIFEGQVADILGRAWTCVFVSVDEVLRLQRALIVRLVLRGELVASI